MNSQLVYTLIMSLFLTLVLEVFFFYLSRKRNRIDLLLLIMVNIITNPLVVIIHWLMVAYTSLNITITTLALEALAVYSEGLYYKKYAKDITRPFLFSLGANLFSFLIGVLLQNI